MKKVIIKHMLVQKVLLARYVGGPSFPAEREAITATTAPIVLPACMWIGNLEIGMQTVGALWIRLPYGYGKTGNGQLSIVVGDAAP